MTPYFFGEEDEPLFGVYAPPRASVARDSAVLMCAPVGMEYQRAHYAIRLVAVQLAAAGFHVLRFDYHGTGDSSGNVGKGQLERWVNDVAVAAHELFDVSGAQHLTVVGLRFGAALAVEALTRKNVKAKGIVLWDPVVSGRDYLASLERMHAELGAERKAPPQQTDEFLGASFPGDLRTAIQGMDISKSLPNAQVAEVAVVVSEDLPGYRALLSAVRQDRPETIYRSTDDKIQWDNLMKAYEGRMTGPIVRAVAEVAESIS